MKSYLVSGICGGILSLAVSQSYAFDYSKIEPENYVYGLTLTWNMESFKRESFSFNPYFREEKFSFDTNNREEKFQDLEELSQINSYTSDLSNVGKVAFTIAVLKTLYDSTNKKSLESLLESD